MKDVIKIMKEIGSIAVFIIQMFINSVCIAIGVVCVIVSLHSEQTLESGYLVGPMGILLFVYGLNEYIKTMKTFMKEEKLND